jgi:hypothetical protein
MTAKATRRPEALQVSKDVARHVLDMRTRFGWTQHELAYQLAHTDVPLARPAIAAIEASLGTNARVRAITVDELCALATALKTSPEVLLRGPDCRACGDSPPAGFTCNTCGGGAPPAEEPA